MSFAQTIDTSRGSLALMATLDAPVARPSGHRSVHAGSAHNSAHAGKAFTGCRGFDGALGTTVAKMSARLRPEQDFSGVYSDS
jgi:hypothetical protein